MKRITLSLIVMIALAGATANAQMRGGGSPQGRHGTPGAGMSGAQVDMAAMGSHRGLIVGADGTAYVVRVSATATVPAFEVVAVDSSGAELWSREVGPGMTFIQISGDHLVVATRPFGFGWQEVPVAAVSTLIGLSVSNGTEAWRVELDGFALDIEPYVGGTYVIVVKPQFDGPTGGTRPGLGGRGYATRSLVAIGADGTVRWTKSLSD